MTPKTFWIDRPVFVTGATGLIGCALVRQLLDLGADVVCLVRDWVPQSEFVRVGMIDRVNLVRGDLRDQDLLVRAVAEYEIQTVIHLAAQSIVGVANREPANTLDVNIRGTWTLLEACRRSPLVKEVVLASTDKVYGDVEQLPYTEDMPYLAKYPHDVSKACAELIGRTYVDTYQLNVAVTRLPNIYGGGDLNWNRIIPGAIRSALRGQPPMILSDGKFIRDFLYVEDAAAAHLALTEALASQPEIKGEAFNITSETRWTILELVEEILKLMGSDLAPEVKSQNKQEIRSQYLSGEKARRVLGWAPSHSMAEGLQATIEWYQNYLEKLEE